MSVILAMASLCLPGCASKVDYAPKTTDELDQETQEHRVFYEGWLHPGAPRESREPADGSWR